MLPIRVLAMLLDQFAFFPITRDQLTMLMEGNTCEEHDAFGLFGRVPAPFDQAGLAYLRVDVQPF